MAQWLKALIALPEVLSSNLGNDMVAHNHLYWDLMPSSGVCLKTATVYLDIVINKSFLKKEK